MLSYAEARRIIRIHFCLVELYSVHPACQGEAWLILSEAGKILTLVAVWIYLLILSVKLNRRSEI